MKTWYRDKECGHQYKDLTVEQMADMPTSQLTRIAHDMLDPLWLREDTLSKQRRKRKKLYKAISKRLGVPETVCHFKTMDRDQVIHAIIVLQRKI